MGGERVGGRVDVLVPLGVLELHTKRRFVVNEMEARSPTEEVGMSWRCETERTSVPEVLEVVSSNLDLLITVRSEGDGF